MSGRYDTQAGGARRIAGWSLERIAAAVDGSLVGDDEPGRAPTAVCSDTRKLERGELFVALRGERFDGHDFLEGARDGGACAAIIDDREARPTDLAAIVVDDALEALSRLGHAIWREARAEGLHTVDVTGSNGKTTVKEMLAALWKTRGEVFATPGNLNNHIGVPLVLCDIPAGCEHLILELGANAAGEISHLVGLAPGEERVITSIGTAHVEGFGSVYGIRRAKSEIFEGADKETLGVVPHDEAARLVDADFKGRVVTVGFDQEADMRVKTQRSDRAGVAQIVDIDGALGSWRIELVLPGSHNALNVATSLATLAARGLAPSGRECTEALAGLSLPAGRWRDRIFGRFRVIDDAYNANPSSVRASVDAYLETDDEPPRPRIAVVGYMAELGERAEAYHRRLAADLAEREGLDALVFVGQFAEAMAEAAGEVSRKSALDTVACEDARAAAQWLDEQGRGFVLLKASRQARLERVVDFLTGAGED